MDEDVIEVPHELSLKFVEDLRERLEPILDDFKRKIEAKIKELKAKAEGNGG